MTSPQSNPLGQPIGFAVPGWAPPPRPGREPEEGRYCRIEPIDERHASELHTANMNDEHGQNWTYLPYGPFTTQDEYRRWLVTTCLGEDPLFHTIIDLATGRAVGVASYLRIAPENGSIEVGHINYSPLLQRARSPSPFS